MPTKEITLTGEAVLGLEPYSDVLKAADVVPRTVKLGRKPPRGADKIPNFSKFFDSSRMATPPPASTNYRAKAKASLDRMYVNDQLGCCVISGKYHATGVWTGNDSPTVVVGSDQEVINSYHAICGPGDNGCVITDVLDVMRDRGLPFGGVNHKIDGYVKGDWTNKDQVKAIQYLFGSSSIGIDLPEEWTRSAVWDVTNSYIVGGHDVTPVDYDDKGVYVSSWGRIYLITWAAFNSRRWLMEYYALLSPDWYGSDKLAPSGVDVTGLKAAMDVVKGGGVPSVDPVVPPPGPGPSPAPGTGTFILDGMLTTTNDRIAGNLQMGVPPDGKAFHTGTIAVSGSTFVGTVRNSLVSDEQMAELVAQGINPAIFLDLVQIVLMFQMGNIPGLIEAVIKLLKDLGVKI